MTRPEPYLDEPTFDVNEVASMAGIRTKDVANWSDRGLVDPYQAATLSRRGRGQARRYSLRDALRFSLMGDLARRYQLPLPLGKRICGAIFSEAFSPLHCGYLVVEGASVDHVGTAWFADSTELAARLRLRAMASCLVVNTAVIFGQVMQVAARLSAVNSKGPRERGKEKTD